MFRRLQIRRQKTTWRFWVTFLALLTFPATWKFWVVIPWQIAHPNSSSSVRVKEPFPWMRVTANDAVFVRYNSMSPLWGDKFSTAVVGLSLHPDAYATDEAWAEHYKHALEQKGGTVEITKPKPTLVCASTLGNEIVMRCHTKEGMILKYEGSAAHSGEAVDILTRATRPANL